MPAFPRLARDYSPSVGRVTFFAEWVGGDDGRAVVWPYEINNVLPAEQYPPGQRGRAYDEAAAEVAASSREGYLADGCCDFATGYLVRFDTPDELAAAMARRSNFRPGTTGQEDEAAG